MNILVVGEANSWFDQHVTASLHEIGHQVSVFHYGIAVGEYYSRARRQEREGKNRALLHQAEALKAEGRLDLIFCYVYDDFLLPEFAASLRAIGAPMLNYNVDMTNQWYRQTRIAPYFTAMLCAQRVHMDDLARYGTPTYYLPMAARALTHMQDRPFFPAPPVSFVGTPMPYRMAVLSALLEVGIPVSIYGKFWKEGRLASPDYSLEKTFDDALAYGLARLGAEGIGPLWTAFASRLIGKRLYSGKPVNSSYLHGFIAESALPSLFRHSKINLGFTRMVEQDPSRPGITQTRLRDFEVPASGGFYLVEEAPDYKELFEFGREVETWRTTDELIEKIGYYLTHENERATIAAAGQSRALREHLWTHRFTTLFAKLGLA